MTIDEIAKEDLEKEIVLFEDKGMPMSIEKLQSKIAMQKTIVALAMLIPGAVKKRQHAINFLLRSESKRRNSRNKK